MGFKNRAVDTGIVIGGVLSVLAVPMPSAPPVPVFYPIAPKSRTESGLRYLSYAMILFAVTSAAGIALTVVLFPLIAAMTTFQPGSPPDPALLGSVFAIVGASCAIFIVSLLGAIFGLIGLYNVHEGGDEFGPEHSRRVQRGLIVAIVGSIVPLVLSAPVGFLGATASPFPGPGTAFVPTFSPVAMLGQLALGLVSVILLGLFLHWTVELLATPAGMTRATWAFALGIVGVGAWGLASLAAVALVPFPPGPQDLPLLVVLPSAIRGGISIASLVAWYVVYHGVLERFRRRELVARPLGIYLPAPPYYPGYPAPPMSPSAASPPPPSPPAEGHPEKPPGT